MNLAHLTASTFFGGPERQMLGLARALRSRVRTTFISFAEGGRCDTFLKEVRPSGFETLALAHDTPHLLAATRELSSILKARETDVLLCHGYKSILLGRLAARRAGIPGIAVSRGWTGESRRVRGYEWLERRTLRFMDHVVCVSEGQAEKVRRWCGVAEGRLSVIHNSARLEALARRDTQARMRLLAFFPSHARPQRLVLAAGRLSPEKGFSVLVEAAASVCQAECETGIILFGDGFEREALERRAAQLGLGGRFLLPGFRTDLDSLLGAADLVVLPSFTEGLPNVALEAAAAGVAVVATAVGGTPEVVAEGETGRLVPPGQPEALAGAILELLRDPALRARMGEAGRRRMREQFTFEAQARAYLRLFDSLRPSAATAAA